MTKKPTTTPEQILQDHSPDVQAIAQRLRQIIRDAIPDATEKAYPGWHGIGYRHPTAGYFGCIFPFDDRVNLALEFGAFLPDPDHLMIDPPTGGKQVRYIPLYSEQDIQTEKIVALLHAAIALKS